MKNILFRSLLISSSLLAACSEHKASNSETKEAPDRNSSFEVLGDIGSPTFEDLNKTKSVITPRQPWTDTYWPLTEQGMARRWVKSDKLVGLADYFTTQAEAAKTQVLDTNLSPADKYDILYRWRHGVAVDEVETNKLTAEWTGLETSLDLSAELKTNRELLKKTFAQFRSPAMANFKKQFPMSSDGWESWLNYSSSDEYMLMDLDDSGEDWSWMGSCHGWAPAALMAETPKHSVLAKFD
ncbi:MAG: hypothetical protein EOP10_31260, partial [Proteobacteria bacterium]